MRRSPKLHIAVIKQMNHHLNDLVNAAYLCMLLYRIIIHLSSSSDYLSVLTH